MKNFNIISEDCIPILAGKNSFEISIRNIFKPDNNITLSDNY